MSRYKIKAVDISKVNPRVTKAVAKDLISIMTKEKYKDWWLYNTIIDYIKKKWRLFIKKAG